MADCSGRAIPPDKAKFFNTLPHVNFDFDNISTIFKPTDKDYQQNLLLYSTVPAILGVVFFIIFGIYFIVYCCTWCCKRCRKQITRRRTKTKCAVCLSVCIWLSALLSFGSIISTFVFNDGIDNGVRNVTMAMDNVTDTFSSIHTQVASIQNNILDIKENIDDMLNLHDIPFTVEEYLRSIRSSILQIIEQLNGVKTVSPPDITDDIRTGEYYRWWSTFGVLGLAILTCLFAVYSSIRNSRCGFFFALLLGCLTFLLNWVVIGAHLGASIGMSDLCVNPRKTISFYTKSSSRVTKDIINYYLDCKHGSHHPYEKYVDSSFELIHSADEFLQKLRNQSWPPLHQDLNKLTSDLDNIELSLNGIQENFKCTRIKKEYNEAHCAICFPVVGGLTWLLIASLALVVFLVVMLLLITPLCRRIHKKRRPSNFTNSMLNGSQSEETQYHSVTSDDETMPLVPSNSPPPYEAVIAGSADFQFHSCQEDRHRPNPSAPPRGEDRHRPNPSAPPSQHIQTHQPQDNAASSQQNNFAPPPPRGEVVTQKKVTMAF